MSKTARDFVMGFAVPSGRWCGNCSFRYQTNYAGRDKEERCLLYGVLQGDILSSSDDWKESVAFRRANTCLKVWPDGGIAEVVTAKKKVACV